jgi:2-oxoglutarate ferredoxin oxidoreductase subunit alpha
MNAKRREKIKALAATLPPPELGGDASGEALIVTWGSNYGPAREALERIRAAGVSAGHLHIRHVHPLPHGLEDLLGRYRKVVVAELNDEGVYGFGQFTTLLRARYALPSIVSVCKTDGLTFKVSELVAGVARHLGNATLESLVSQARPSPLAAR